MDWLKVFIAKTYDNVIFVLGFSISLLRKLENFWPIRSAFWDYISEKLIRLKTALEFIRFLLQSAKESFEISFHRGLLYVFLLIIIGIYLYYDIDGESIIYILKFKHIYNQLREG